MALKKEISAIALLLVALAWAAGVQAIPALQIGAGSDAARWTYDSGDETWLYTGGDSPFDILATANGTQADGANGSYAWDAGGAGNQYAYLVVSALPHLSAGTDFFDVSVADDSGALAMIDSGWGNPPLNDPNSLSGHGIFDAYLEVFEFQFDAPSGEISNTQPGESGAGQGFSEYLDVTINSLLAGVEGIHFDLFTVFSDTSDPVIRAGAGGSGALPADAGRWDPSDPANRQMVYSFAPYSHDGGTGDCCDRQLTEPATVGLMIMGLIGIGASRYRRRRARK
jgi:hypothetical protein